MIKSVVKERCLLATLCLAPFTWHPPSMSTNRTPRTRTAPAPKLLGPAGVASVAACFFLVSCAPSIGDVVRREARSHSNGELRLDCEPEEVAIERLTRDGSDAENPRGVAGLSAVAVERYAQDGSLYRAFCPGVRCCENADHGGGTVAVFCVAGECAAVGDTLGDCLTVNCATF